MRKGLIIIIIIIIIDLSGNTLLSTSMLYSDTARHQEEVAKKVLAKDNYGVEIKYVCGVDVSYKNNIGYCSATILDKDTLNAVECANTIVVIDQPYIPGLFILREYKPIMNALQMLKREFQILLVDGHGLLHPRRCGLACYVGIMMDKPTIGVAKSLLCGLVRKDKFVEFGGDILGFQITNGHKKHIYVSIGHRVSLGSAINIVKELTRTGQLIPEPLRIADISSKKLRQFCTI
jgi:deoxyribonuclease V